MTTRADRVEGGMPEPVGFRRVMLSRYKCDGCGRTLSQKRGMQGHVSRCWKLPANKACLTCAHLVEEWEGGCDCGNWRCQDVARYKIRGCAVDDSVDLTEKPRSNCPMWVSNTNPTAPTGD